MELTEGLAIGKVAMAAISLVTVCLCGCGSGGGVDAGGVKEAPRSFTVTFGAGPNGSVTGSTSQIVTQGGATSPVTALPEPGYHLVNWTGDNGFVTSTANPLVVAKVSASQTIKANFAANPTGVRLKLIISGSLQAGRSLSGIAVKILLPAGVTVATEGTDLVQSGVVVPSGEARASSLNFVRYLPGEPGTPAALEFLVVSNEAGGFAVGEFATVNCVLSGGSSPGAGEFLIPAADFRASDLQLQPVTGLTVSLTLTVH